MHVGELGESLRQLVRLLGLGEAVVGGVEVVVNGVGVGAVLNGNKVVVGGGKVFDACVVAALWGGTEEIVKFWYGKLETCPEIAGMGIYLKTSGPCFFDADIIFIYICNINKLYNPRGPETRVFGRCFSMFQFSAVPSSSSWSLVSRSG